MANKPKMITYQAEDGILSFSHGDATYKVMKNGNVKLPAGEPWVEALKDTHQIGPIQARVQQPELNLAANDQDDPDAGKGDTDEPAEK